MGDERRYIAQRLASELRDMAARGGVRGINDVRLAHNAAEELERLVAIMEDSGPAAGATTPCTHPAHQQHVTAGGRVVCDGCERPAIEGFCEPDPAGATTVAPPPVDAERRREEMRDELNAVLCPLCANDQLLWHAIDAIEALFTPAVASPAPTREQVRKLVGQMVSVKHEPARSAVIEGWVNEWMALLAAGSSPAGTPQEDDRA